MDKQSHHLRWSTLLLINIACLLGLPWPFMTCSFLNFTSIIIYQSKHTSLVFNTVPSQPPTAFQLTASSSTSITASWQLPPVFARHGNIAGFKLFYKKKGSGGSATTLSINNGATLSRTVSGLDKFTEYEFQVLAFTSGGNGPRSSVKVKRTMEDGMWQSRDNGKTVNLIFWICIFIAGLLDTDLIMRRPNNQIVWNQLITLIYQNTTAFIFMWQVKMW